MLSFMREQGSGNPSEHPAAEAGAREVKPSENAGAQEYYTVATNTKNLRRSTMVVIVLIVMGLLCLWLMIRKSQPQAAAARQAQDDQTEIEAAISRVTGVSSEMVDRMDEIVKKFYEFSDVFQVKVGELVKNPFQVEGYLKNLKGEAVIAQDPREQAELIKRQRMQQQANTLRLLSVMQSNDGDSCMINDQILRPGDKIEEFTVGKIASNSVELVWAPAGASGSQTEPLTILLKLSQ
jgi:preprotein translocase subunit SecG